MNPSNERFYLYISLLAAFDSTRYDVFKGYLVPLVLLQFTLTKTSLRKKRTL